MKNLKIVDLLNTFSAWELRGLGEMVESPYFNKQEVLLPLFMYLRDCLEGEEENRLENISFHLFPGEPFDHQRIRYLLTDLTRLAEEYLVLKQLKENPLLRERLLVEGYRNRHLEKYHDRTLKKAQEKALVDPHKDSENHYQLFRFQEASLGGSSIRNPRDHTENVKKALEELEKFSLSTRLKYMCELVNRQNVVSGDFDLGPARALLSELDQSPFRALPSISIYHRILATLLDSDEESHYHELRALLQLHFPAFSVVELGQLYAFALNYCIKKLNSGRTEYLRELFEVYQELLQQRLLHDGEHLLPRHFKNMVTTAIRLEEFEWTERFIDEYGVQLPSDTQQNAQNYNLAALAYARSEYSASLRLLQQVEFTDVFYQLDSKALLLKSYYELDEFEPLLSLVESFKTYLRRNKVLSDYQRRVYLNLVKYVKKLVQIRLGGRKTPEALRVEVEQTREVADLRWLLGKIEEISNE